MKLNKNISSFHTKCCFRCSNYQVFNKPRESPLSITLARPERVFHTIPTCLGKINACCGTKTHALPGDALPLPARFVVASNLNNWKNACAWTARIPPSTAGGLYHQQSDHSHDTTKLSCVATNDPVISVQFSNSIAVMFLPKPLIHLKNRTINQRQSVGIFGGLCMHSWAVSQTQNKHMVCHTQLLGRDFKKSIGYRCCPSYWCTLQVPRHPFSVVACVYTVSLIAFRCL